MAQSLLEAGAPLDICTAAMLGLVAQVKAMLAADPGQARAVGAHGISVLYHAAIRGRVEWLLAHGARVNALDSNSKTPLQVALDNGHAGAAEALRRHGGTA